MKNARRGRPKGSAVRQNMIEILYAYGPMHGYDIYKKYIEHYPQITLRLIYYHLKKGTELNELKVNKIDKKTGDYSWGSTSENIVYELGPDARALGNIQKIK